MLSLLPACARIFACIDLGNTGNQRLADNVCPPRPAPPMQLLGEALGARTCGQLLAQRALVSALFTPTAADFLLGSALGLGATRHPPPLAADELPRKGIRWGCNIGGAGWRGHVMM